MVENLKNHKYYALQENIRGTL